MELVTIRRVILGVLLLGMTGLLAELLLIGHYEDRPQLIPLMLAGSGIAALLVQLVHPRGWTSSLVAIVMVLFIGAGLLGMFFHFRGSSEFQLEVDPTMSGTTLMWHVLRAKSPPTLSPGTMIQMGILGLGYAYLLNGRR
jgi:hypothetical protein